MNSYSVPNKKFKYPIILLKRGDDLQEFLSPKKINKLKTVDDLISVLNEKLSVLTKTNTEEIDLKI